MKLQRFAVVLTVLNFVLLMVLLAQLQPVRAQQAPGLIRGTGLEIVDAQGRKRATISVHDAVETGGQTYPEAVVFRLISPNGAPNVKIDASEEGAGFGLSANSREAGVRVMAKNRTGVFVQVTAMDGRQQTIKP